VPPAKTASKKDSIQLAEIDARIQITAQVLGLIKTAITAGAAVWCVWIVVEGLKFIVLSNPANIKELAKVVESFHLNTMMGTLVGLAGVSYGLYERKGKKRLLAGYAKERREAEKADPYNATSGLTDSGDTPI